MNRVNFDLPKVSKISTNFELLKVQNDQFENLCIFSHGEARNIKFGQQVNIERVPLGTPSQVVGMTLAQSHDKSLYCQL